MELEDTQCCAIKEINGLSDYADPAHAMNNLCEQLQDDDLYGDGDDGHYDHNNNWIPTKSGKLQIPGLITFTGVVKWEKGAGRTGDVTYGPKFAAFIMKEKLGAVTQSPLTTNRINHPGRQIRAWMWKPNVKQLNAWWAKQQKED